MGGGKGNKGGDGYAGKGAQWQATPYSTPQWGQQWSDNYNAWYGAAGPQSFGPMFKGKGAYADYNYGGKDARAKGARGGRPQWPSQCGRRYGYVGDGGGRYCEREQKRAKVEAALSSGGLQSGAPYALPIGPLKENLLSGHEAAKKDAESLGEQTEDAAMSHDMSSLKSIQSCSEDVRVRPLSQGPELQALSEGGRESRDFAEVYQRHGTRFSSGADAIRQEQTRLNDKVDTGFSTLHSAIPALGAKFDSGTKFHDSSAAGSLAGDSSSGLADGCYLVAQGKPCLRGDG